MKDLGTMPKSYQEYPIKHRERERERERIGTSCGGLCADWGVDTNRCIPQAHNVIDQMQKLVLFLRRG